MFKKFKKAFTLAEVLITLVIIGVVAAITVPSIQQSTNREETVARVKKAHSTLAQSIMRMSVESGYPVGDFSYMEGDDFFDNFAMIVNTAKICKGSDRGCFSDKSNQLNGTFWAGYNRQNSLITADGVAYGWDVKYCDGKGLTPEDQSNCIGRFIVDVNGGKTPNRFGYDIFFFTVVDKKGIVPAGAGNDSADCKRGGSGITCAAKILREGKITYL